MSSVFRDSVVFPDLSETSITDELIETIISSQDLSVDENNRINRNMDLFVAEILKNYTTLFINILERVNHRHLTAERPTFSMSLLQTTGAVITETKGLSSTSEFTPYAILTPYQSVSIDDAFDWQRNDWGKYIGLSIISRVLNQYLLDPFRVDDGQIEDESNIFCSVPYKLNGEIIALPIEYLNNPKWFTFPFTQSTEQVNIATTALIQQVLAKSKMMLKILQSFIIDPSVVISESATQESQFEPMDEDQETNQNEIPINEDNASKRKSQVLTNYIIALVERTIFQENCPFYDPDKLEPLINISQRLFASDVESFFDDTSTLNPLFRILSGNLFIKPSEKPIFDNHLSNISLPSLVNPSYSGLIFVFRSIADYLKTLQGVLTDFRPQSNECEYFLLKNISLLKNELPFTIKAIEKIISIIDFIQKNRDNSDFSNIFASIQYDDRKLFKLVLEMNENLPDDFSERQILDYCYMNLQYYDSVQHLVMPQTIQYDAGILEPERYMELMDRLLNRDRALPGAFTAAVGEVRLKQYQSVPVPDYASLQRFFPKVKLGKRKLELSTYKDNDDDSNPPPPKHHKTS